MPADVLDVTNLLLSNPVRILVKKEELTLEGIRQFYISIDKEVYIIRNYICLKINISLFKLYLGMFINLNSYIIII